MEHSGSKTGIVERDELSLKEIIFTIKDLAKYLWSKRKFIAAVIIFGGGVGLTYSMITPVKYTATTTFVVESTKKGGLSEYASIASKFGLSSPSGGGLFQEDNNIITFMKSRTMIAQTLYSSAEFESGKQLIVDHYCNFNGFWGKWKKNNTLRNIRFHPNPAERSITEDSLVTVFYKQIIKGNLNVNKPDKDEDIIQVVTTSTDELFAKAFNERIIENVASFYVETQTKKSLENVNILEHQVDSIRGLLNAALSSVAVSAEANPNPNPAFQRIKVPSQKRMIDVELNKSLLEELVKNLEISKIALRKETPLVQVIDGPILPLEKRKLGKLKGILLGVFISGLIIVTFFSLQFFLRGIIGEQRKSL